MADQHKYYYMRLKENFFDDDSIKIKYDSLDHSVL